MPESSANLPLLESAAACYRGDFLAGFSLGDAPGFDDWVGIQREVWRRRLGLILDRLSEIQYARGEFSSTAETAALWIGLDALNERAYRRKMRGHFAAGERGHALETYAACRAILAAELRSEPEPDTEALAAQIRGPQALSRADALPPRPDTPVAFLERLFVGRTAERRTLEEHYAFAVQRKPQVLTLHGELGIGKTRLATEYLAWCRAQGAAVLEARAFESGSHVPFQPLVEALRLRLERENVSKDGLREAWLAPLIQLLSELRERYPELPLPDTDADPDGQAGQRRLFEPLVRLMAALAGPAPFVLFLDDFQWVDSATLEVLQYAARRWRAAAAPVVLLVGVRSEALRPPAQPQQPNLTNWLVQVEREMQPFHLELGPLGQAETVQMVRSILAPPAADFAQWVYDETRGQPFYLMETLKDLLERGALHARRPAGGGWAFEVDAEHDLGQAVRVPSTVRAVILARLNRLSPNAMALLTAGAALEHGLTFDRLCAIANVPQDSGLAALDELVSGRLLLEVAQPGAASAYGFANDMIRGVVYTEAGDARRRLFHRRALNVLAAAHAPAAVLAHHALAAGEAEPAFHYSVAAGQEALRLFAASEARVHLEQARQLAREASPARTEFEGRIRDLYTQLGRVFELDGQPEQAAAIYAEVERLAPRRSAEGK